MFFCNENNKLVYFQVIFKNINVYFKAINIKYREATFNIANFRSHLDIQNLHKEFVSTLIANHNLVILTRFK